MSYSDDDIHSLAILIASYLGFCWLPGVETCAFIRSKPCTQRDFTQLARLILDHISEDAEHLDNTAG